MPDTVLQWHHKQVNNNIIVLYRMYNVRLAIIYMYVYCVIVYMYLSLLELLMISSNSALLSFKDCKALEQASLSPSSISPYSHGCVQ